MRLFHIMDCPFPIGILLSFLGSVSFWFLNSHECGHFTGIWVLGIPIIWVGIPVVTLWVGNKRGKDC